MLEMTGGGNTNIIALQQPQKASKVETEEQIDKRIRERFNILESLVNSCMKGDVRSLIVSGPAGLGKSYTVEQALAAWDPKQDKHTVIKGYVRPTGLYISLYNHRFAGNVLVFDDADTIFFDDTSLNMLKAVCDTTERRTVSYLAETTLISKESADVLPQTFQFDGTVIFITNYDFDSIIENKGKLAPHMAALVSRSYYIDLTMKTKTDYMVRIKQVVRDGLFDTMKLTADQQKDVMEFIETNIDKLREISLRTAIKVAGIRKGTKNWESIARITTCKN